MLIIGGSGQVGWELQRALLPLGEVVLARRDALDLSAPETFEKVLDIYQPDAVINAGAYTAVDAAEAHPELADAINHRAVAVLADLAARRGIWLVHYSSDYVFDGHGSAPFNETHPTGPLNIYGASKLAGDLAIVAASCKHLILRTSWVYSPRGSNFVRSILRLAGERDQLRVVADQFGAPTSAELIADITAHALARLEEAGGGSGIYHLAAAGETNWHHIAQTVVAEARRLGCHIKLEPLAIEPITTSQYQAAAVRPLNSRLDTGKLREIFGVALPDWRAGVERTVAELVAS
ncbi:MAG: dTDP-4-dehydrorhamnose reductase [Kaiparowitsia implicata GSE-PSE-MK54-09C]|jgi:dTDP-4-dehydrorhamnose reductase|nr:dTDP-4-dehydrorhamnose reductase [Kaiparowitsia implicata GSE-PSE-MK54-09C]